MSLRLIVKDVAMARCLIVFALLALLSLGAAAAEAAAPAGPRLAVAVIHPYPDLDLSGIETVGPNGESPQRVVDHGSHPTWSPDGSLLAFYGGDSPYVVGSEGGKPRLVAKAIALSAPIFSPDGRRLVFSTLRVVKGHFERPRGRSQRRYGVIVDWAILSVSLDGKRKRNVVGWKRNQQFTPFSYSPDGRYLTAERYNGRREDAVVIDLKTRAVRVIAHDGGMPVFSPDGSGIAYVRTRYRPPAKPGGYRPPGSSALLVVPASLTGEPKRIARIQGGLGSPSWDPSGSRIAFTRLEGGDVFLPNLDQGNSVMQVNADGSCLSRMLSIDRGVYESVAWQPGPGRDAGPIAC